jgi:nucleoid-associated protein YgaU
MLYETKAGDTLSDIAQEVLGDASRWREIYEANRKRIGGDPDKLATGVTLNIPENGGPAAKTYVTVEGDTLWEIAQRFYGDGSRWNAIHEANRKAIGDDPDTLRPSLTLTIPG